MTDNTQELDEPINQHHVALWRLQDLEETIADAAPEELPELHSKLVALSTDLTQALLDWHDKQVEEAMAKFHLKKGVKYDVKAGGSVIVITHTNKLKEREMMSNYNEKEG